jgi:hypothetical protein
LQVQGGVVRATTIQQFEACQEMTGEVKTETEFLLTRKRHMAGDFLARRNRSVVVRHLGEGRSDGSR